MSTRAVGGAARKQRSSWSARQKVKGLLREVRRCQTAGRWSVGLRQRSIRAIAGKAVCRQVVCPSTIPEGGVLRMALAPATIFGRLHAPIGPSPRRYFMTRTPLSACKGRPLNGLSAASVNRGRPLAANSLSQKEANWAEVSHGLSLNGGGTASSVSGGGRRTTESGRGRGLRGWVRVALPTPLTYALRGGGDCNCHILRSDPAMSTQTAALRNYEGLTGGGSQPIYANDCTQTGHSYNADSYSSMFLSNNYT